VKCDYRISFDMCGHHLGYLVRTGIDLATNNEVLCTSISFVRGDLPKYFRGLEDEDNNSPCENGPPAVLRTDDNGHTHYISSLPWNHPG
jgi:hypothetical protein